MTYFTFFTFISSVLMSVFVVVSSLNEYLAYTLKRVIDFMVFFLFLCAVVGFLVLMLTPFSSIVFSLFEVWVN